MSPYFFLKKIRRPFLVVTLPSSHVVYPVIFLNTSTKNNVRSGVTPWRVSPWAVRPPSDATGTLRWSRNTCASKDFGDQKLTSRQLSLPLDTNITLVLCHEPSCESHPHPPSPFSVQFSLMHQVKMNKKLRYREEHSASVVLSWCTL